MLVGAGTLRVERDHVWTPEHVFPEAAGEFAALRSALGKPPRPPTVFVTASGEIDLGAPAFVSGDPVVVLTTAAGAARLGRTGAHVRVHPFDPRVSRVGGIVDTLASEAGWRLVLTEGGPTLLGELLRERALDELFLTLAPQLAGRAADERRLGLVEGVAFTPEGAPWGRLLSVKRSHDHYLFLRLAL